MMIWIDIKDKFPECWSQHGSSFSTGDILTYNVAGEFIINQYWEHGEHTGNGWIKKSSGWDIETSEVTHWCELITPPITKNITVVNNITLEDIVENIKSITGKTIKVEFIIGNIKLSYENNCCYLNHNIMKDYDEHTNSNPNIEIDQLQHISNRIIKLLNLR